MYEDWRLTGGLIQVWGLLPQTFDGSMEVGGLHRFDHIIVHACGQTSFPITLHGMCGHGNDRHTGAAVLLVLPNGCSGLKAIHLWHLHIHKYQVKALVQEGIKSLLPIAHGHHSMAPFLQQAYGQPLVHRVVLGQQDVQAVVALAH